MPFSQVLSFAPRPSAAALADGYVTDGKRLLRVVTRFDAGAQGTFASLEDCMTLEVRPYTSGELGAMAVRTVVPSTLS
jgi:hypothetical protein